MIRFQTCILLFTKRWWLAHCRLCSTDESLNLRKSYLFPVNLRKSYLFPVNGSLYISYPTTLVMILYLSSSNTTHLSPYDLYIFLNEIHSCFHDPNLWFKIYLLFRIWLLFLRTLQVLSLKKKHFFISMINLMDCHRILFRKTIFHYPLL